MKKLLLASALIAISLTSFAQTQIPNGDFENWTKSKYCPDLDSLAHFISRNQTYHDNSGDCYSESAIGKSTNSHSGTYALELKAYDEHLTNFVSIGHGPSWFDYGVPFTGKPKKLIGYYKFIRGGTDTLGISVDITGGQFNDDDIALGYFTAKSSTTGDEYAKFEIILDYDESVTVSPTELVLYINLSNSDNEADAATQVLIDDLSFEYETETPTSVMNYDNTSSINVFAVNKHINFSENVSDIQVIDMVGANKMQETASVKSLNAAALNTGLYIVTYKYNNNYFSKKIVLE